MLFKFMILINFDFFNILKFYRLWLHQISNGIDLEQVTARQTSKSVGCSKNFRGKLVLDRVKKVRQSHFEFELSIYLK